MAEELKLPAWQVQGLTLSQASEKTYPGGLKEKGVGPAHTPTLLTHTHTRVLKIAFAHRQR